MSTKSPISKCQTSKCPVVVMISGRGSNLQALLVAQANAPYEIVGVVTDRPEAQGLEHASKFGVPAVSHTRSAFETLRAHKQAIYDSVDRFKPRFVALAGFMQIVESEFVESYRGRLINIHPSLLPQFPGLHTHERAIEEGTRRATDSTLPPMQHGCSVHFVDAEVDTGPVIAQASLEVHQHDDSDSLAARVLALEHSLYAWVISQLAMDRISLSESNIVVRHETACLEAKKLGFLVP